MTDSRINRAKLNIFVSLAYQIITVICGLVIPGLMIRAFGSELYGATASIAQFLAYITLLEGGIAGVARAALYKPLAQNNNIIISAVVSEIQRFFKVIAYIFVLYALVLACFFKFISHTDSLDWITSFLLVVVISISTFGQYFIGISNSVLLQAAQKSYITHLISIVATVLNAVFVVILVHCGCDIITVKLVSSCIFLLRPVAMWLYVRHCYSITKCNVKNTVYLEQKWTGLGQHIAYFLHSNTDIAILTIFADLTSVAVYSVYNLIVAHMQELAMSFLSGMEALFGDMMAKEEYDQLQRTFGYYETLISVISITLFAATTALIIPFIRLYTSGVNDVNYIRPEFSLVLILASVVYCLRMPYHSVVIAAGHFKRTRLAAYGEAGINILLSILLVGRFGLLGVALGTLLATVFRFLYYVIYLSRHIIKRKITLFVKRFIVNVVAFTAACSLGLLVQKMFDPFDYLHWIFCAIAVVFVVAVIVITLNSLLYREDFVKLRFNRRKVVGD